MKKQNNLTEYFFWTAIAKYYENIISWEKKYKKRSTGYGICGCLLDIEVKEGRSEAINRMYQKVYKERMRLYPRELPTYIWPLNISGYKARIRFCKRMAKETR